MNSLYTRLFNRLKVTPKLISNNISYLLNDTFSSYKETRKRLNELRGLHTGMRCFLIGNGPSVRLNDLEKLKDEITFCCNRFHLCYKNTTFRASYLVSADDYMIKDFGREISSSANKLNQKSFYGMIHNPLKYLEDSKNVFWLRVNRKRPFKFSTDISNSLGTGGASLIFAAQVAFHMGIKEMYLYGVDHNFNFTMTKSKNTLANAVGDGNHFIKNYRSEKKWVPPSHKLIEESFASLSNFLHKNRGCLFNCSRFSNLPLIKKLGFDSVI